MRDVVAEIDYKNLLIAVSLHSFSCVSCAECGFARESRVLCYLCCLGGGYGLQVG
jgi:hypothetical protein